jgi:hypothetical protein
MLPSESSFDTPLKPNFRLSGESVGHETLRISCCVEFALFFFLVSERVLLDKCTVAAGLYNGELLSELSSDSGAVPARFGTWKSWFEAALA